MPNEVLAPKTVDCTSLVVRETSGPIRSGHQGGSDARY
jgi:hypothetical protein